MTNSVIDTKKQPVKMIHPIFGEILVKKARKIEGYTIAYYDDSFCNMNILKKV